MPSLRRALRILLAGRRELRSTGPPETKDRYGFPFGDFRRVSRAALIHAKQRAAQNGHDAVADAAGQLLERLDQAHAA